jgi:PKD domain-containing protein
MGALPVLVVLAAVGFSAPASAQTLCVPATLAPGCDAAYPTLQGALDAAAVNIDGRDRIQIGVHDELLPAVNAVGSQVDIVGLGNLTTLRGGGGNTPRLKIDDPTSTVSNLEVRLNASSSIGIESKGQVSDVTVVAEGPAATDLVGVQLKGSAGLDGAQIFLPMVVGSSNDGVRTESVGSTSTVQDAYIEAATGVNVLNAGVPGPTNRTVVRKVRVRGSTGVNANQSLVLVDDTVVEATSTGLAALAVSQAADLRARHVTVVGPGGAGPSSGVSTSQLGSGTATATVTNSIVSGFLRDIDIVAGGVAVNRSRFATIRTTPPTGADNTAAAPGFRDPAARDFSLATGSAMIDAGDPAPLAGDEPTTDNAGNPRLVNGNGDCTARRDMGAYEFQPGQRAPVNVVALSAPPSLRTGQAASFLAGGCDPDGDPVTFTWAFDDGTSAGGSSVLKAFSTAGTHTATVTARDPGGRTTTAQTTIAVTAPPPPPPPPAISILAFSMQRTTFAVGSASTPTTAARPPRGSQFRFRLSSGGAVTITIKSLTPGRIVRGRCVKPPRNPGRARRCTRIATVGTLRRTGRAGNNTVAFSGRIGRRALAPGSYRATLAARGARSRTVTFKIVKPG